MVFRTDIEISHSLLSVSIAYKFWQGEPMVRYYPDGSGYPGSPAEFELLSVHVDKWTVGNDARDRDYSWLWEVLDQVAYGYVDDNWDEYESDLAEKESEERDGSE